jgi:hypothetical protein
MMGESSGARVLALAEWLAAIALFTAFLHSVAPALLARFFAHLRSKSVLLLVSVGVLLGFAAILAVNTAYAGFLDHIEPSLVAISWLFRKGAPLYHPLPFADRYSMLYGPSCFLPYALAFWLGGGSTVAAKLVVAATDALTLFLLFRTFRSVFDRASALIAVALLLVVAHALRPNHYFFQVRGDALIICASALGLYGATRRSHWGLGALALGAALLVDSKFTGLIYVIPLFAVVIETRGLRAAAGVAAAVGALATLPFLMPNVSIRQYWTWIQLATGHPRSFTDLRATLLALPILALPLPLISGRAPWKDPRLLEYLRANRARALALGVSLALATIASSRIGAGSHHLLPLLPALGYEYARLYRALKAAPQTVETSFGYGLLWCCVALVLSVRVGGGLREVLLPWTRWEWARDVSNDVTSFVSSQRGHRIQMGYGDSADPVTQYRTEVAFATDRLMLDPEAINDMDLDGVEIPKATFEALASCAADMWLIPKGRAPFTLNNEFSALYPQLIAPRPMFSATFRDAFIQHYRKAEATKYFDVWRCNPAKPDALANAVRP